MTSEQTIRDAKARWARRRRRLIGYGQWQPFTDATPVRTHIEAIRDTGLSLHAIARATGITVATLDHLIYGRTPYPPSSQIRTESAQALLAYWPVLADYPDRAIIDSTGTARRLRALAATGWSIARLHPHIGIVGQPALEQARLHRPRVTARLARAVRSTYRWASEGQAEDHGVTGWVAARSRRMAADKGWHPPAAWDDDEIDNPDACPDYGTRVPRFIALAEDGLELEAQGYTRRQAADRLGVSRDVLQQSISRYRAAIGEAA